MPSEQKHSLIQLLSIKSAYLHKKNMAQILNVFAKDYHI